MDRVCMCVGLRCRCCYFRLWINARVKCFFIGSRGVSFFLFVISVSGVVGFGVSFVGVDPAVLFSLLWLELVSLIV